MPDQTTNRVLMIRPAAFGFNPETAQSNTFQQNEAIPNANSRAVAEFHRMAANLAAAGVLVRIASDTDKPPKPDAIFPNNWVSFHHDQRAVIYPMASPSRQAEVRPALIQDLGYEVVLDLRADAEGRALEGTGSIVLDRSARIGYACLSPRTDEALLKRFSEVMEYRIVSFRATSSGADIYHTNVVMAVGEETVVACMEAVIDPKPLAREIAATGKKLLPITLDQMAHFAGNLLQLRGSKGKVWAMSETAWNAFTPDQKAKLESEGTVVASPIPTIETLGGGSARCMIAELF